MKQEKTSAARKGNEKEVSTIKSGNDDKTKSQGGGNSSKKKHDVTILKYDNKAYSNFARFERELEEIIGYEFSDLFSFAKTGAYPITPTPILKTVKGLIKEEQDSIPSTFSTQERRNELATINQKWSLVDDETRILMDESFKEEWKNEIKVNSSDGIKRKQDKIKLYWMLRSLLSTESLDAIKQHLMADWVNLETSQDPLTLWEAIKTTHKSYSTGLKEIDESKVRMGYAAFKQYKTESLTAFKDRFEVYLRSLESLGLDIPDPRQQAADFLDKLTNQIMNDGYSSRIVPVLMEVPYPRHCSRPTSLYRNCLNSQLPM